MLIRGLILAIALLLAVAIFQTLRGNGLQAENDTLVLKVDRCERARATLQSGLDEQNRRVVTLGEQSRTRMAAAEASLVIARRENAQARSRLIGFLAQPTVGETVCDRVLNIDRRFMTEIVR